MTVKDVLPVLIVGVSFTENKLVLYVFRRAEKLTSIKVLKGRDGPRDDRKQFYQPQAGVNCYYAQSGLVSLSASVLILKWLVILAFPCCTGTKTRMQELKWSTAISQSLDPRATSLQSVQEVVGPISISLAFLTQTESNPFSYHIAG